MKQLVSTSEAAQILGLSLQGIHYRIKKGQLESIKKDGKTFVYIDTDTKPAKTPTKKRVISAEPPKENISFVDKFALKSKDEQIALLKKTIKFMKKQYSSEIARLEQNQQQLIDVFQGEIDLLKSAFNEMKTIYKLEHKENKEIATTSSSKIIKDDEEIETTVETTIKKQVSKKHKLEFMSMKEFFLFMTKHNKTTKEIKQILLDRVKQKDKRFIYNKRAKNIIICKSDFSDIVK